MEYTDEPHPRNTFWEMWGNPMFDLQDAKGVVMELDDCRKANPHAHVRINAFDSTRGFETVTMSFIAHRPAVEPKIVLRRTEADGRAIRYTHEVAR